MKRIVITSMFLVAAAVTLAGCAKTEGQKVDFSDPAQWAAYLESLGYQACESSNECLPVGFCNESGYCEDQCRADADCWLTTYHIENALRESTDEVFEVKAKCSGYACLTKTMVSEMVCTDDAQCAAFKDPAIDAILEVGHLTSGMDMVCKAEQEGGEKHCMAQNIGYEITGGTTIKPTDIPCRYRSQEMCAKYGWPPVDANRDCMDYGWNYVCNETTALCMQQPNVDFGEVDDQDPESWYGVWGTIMTTAARTQGVPLVPYQDTVSFHLMLTRASKIDGKLVFDHNMCYMEMRNFKNDKVFAVGEDLGQLIIPPPYYNNVSSLRMQVTPIPSFAAGTSLISDIFTEIRGLELDDIYNDTLPDRHYYDDHCVPWDEKKDTEACRIFYDQDEDDKVGMTNVGIGALNNQETYSVQRWWAGMNGVEVVDKDHMRGLLATGNLQYQISGSSAGMVYDTETIVHPDADRSYMRMIRLDKFSTCEDVVANYEDENGYLHYTAHMDDMGVNGIVVPQQ